jgi:CubicO group peptidase (beta-lactamase class C family)
MQNPRVSFQTQLSTSRLEFRTVNMMLLWMFATLLQLIAGSSLPAIDPNSFQDGLDLLPTLANQAINSGNVPGLSIAVVYNGTVRYLQGFGVRSVSSNASVDADTVFQLASVSKPLSSTIVAAIISSSNLTWDSKLNSPTTIAEYSDPWVSQQVTIADGFSHRTGLYGLTGDDLESVGYNISTILSRFQYMQPAGRFRDYYAYSNYGITAAAFAASAYIGQEWTDAAQNYLYGPLNMTDSTSVYSIYQSRTNRAALHIPTGDQNLTNETTPTSWQVNVPRDPTAEAPAGGATSSARDLAKWLQFQLALGMYDGKQLIDPAVLNNTRVEHAITGVNAATNLPAFYGLGWNVDVSSIFPVETCLHVTDALLCSTSPNLANSSLITPAPSPKEPAPPSNYLSTTALES